MTIKRGTRRSSEPSFASLVEDCAAAGAISIRNPMLDGKISVVIPAYNEAHHLIGNLRETAATLKSFDADFELIVVDDGSLDGTCMAALEATADRSHPSQVIRYGNNQGKGNALMRGFRNAGGKYVVFLDADMDLHPAQLPNFFQILEEEDADVVIGSKLHPQSRVDYPFIRRVLSAGYYAMVRLLFGLPVRDTQTGLKVFKSEVLSHVLPRLLVKRFAFDLELLAVANHLGYKIREAPVTLEFRRPLGRLKMRDVLHIFQDTLAIFYRLRLRRYYDTLKVLPPEPSMKELVGTRNR